MQKKIFCKYNNKLYYKIYNSDTGKVNSKYRHKGFLWGIIIAIWCFLLINALWILFTLLCHSSVHLSISDAILATISSVNYYAYPIYMAFYFGYVAFFYTRGTINKYCKKSWRIFSRFNVIYTAFVGALQFYSFSASVNLPGFSDWTESFSAIFTVVDFVTLLIGLIHKSNE